jgi:hypothetical protein
MLLPLLLVLQQGLPTVGDTVWITRAYPVARDVSLRPRALAPTPAVEPLGPPEVVARGGDVVVRYPLVVWQPGRHRIEVPGPILVRRDGWSDTLRASAEVLEVASVLPDAPRDSIAPRPPLGMVERRPRTVLPVVVLLGLAALPLAVLHRRWRRAGPAPPAPAPPKVALPSRDRLEEWIAAGELRTAAMGLRLHLLAAAEQGDPDAPALEERLRALRFAETGAPELEAACRAAVEWMRDREGEE